MQTLDINVKVDINNPTQMAAASQFLAALGGVKTPTATLEVVKNDTTQPTTEKPKRKRRTKEEIAADKAAKEAAKNAPVETPTDTSTDAETQAGNQEDNSGEDEVTFAQVRAFMPEKVQAHRDAIRAKLVELEATKNGKTKLGNLDEKHLGAFMKFLKSLA